MGKEINHAEVEVEVFSSDDIKLQNALGMVAHAYNLGTWEVEVGELGIQCHPQLHGEFVSSLDNARLSLKKNDNNK